MEEEEEEEEKEEEEEEEEEEKCSLLLMQTHFPRHKEDVAFQHSPHSVISWTGNRPCRNPGVGQGKCPTNRLLVCSSMKQEMYQYRNTWPIPHHTLICM